MLVLLCALLSYPMYSVAQPVLLDVIGMTRVHYDCPVTFGASDVTIASRRPSAVFWALFAKYELRS